MFRTYSRPLLMCVSVTAAAAMAATCAKSEKSENPLSPNIAGPMPGVEISLPVLLEPGQGWRLKSNEQPLQLLVENAASNSPRPRLYRFEVAADGGFRNIVFAREAIAEGAGGQPGRTALRLPDRLPDGHVYFWRARAYDGANTGSFAGGLNFEIQLPSQLFNPQLVSPVNGQTAENQRPHLRIRNSPRQGPILNVNYAFQVATGSGLHAGARAGIDTREHCHGRDGLAPERGASGSVDRVPGGRWRATARSTAPGKSPRSRLRPCRRRRRPAVRRRLFRAARLRRTTMSWRVSEAPTERR